uniref:Transmembrane protein 207 n=1 Tax=Podarcis muralis TaxID=64176 RepID=A0A670KFU7_PODMU
MNCELSGSPVSEAGEYSNKFLEGWVVSLLREKPNTCIHHTDIILFIFRCDVYEEQSLIAWYIWCVFYISLFLAAILLCIAACCLQCWLKRRRVFSSQRTVAVFALSDADSGHSEFGPSPPAGLQTRTTPPDSFNGIPLSLDGQVMATPPPHKVKQCLTATLTKL